MPKQLFQRPAHVNRTRANSFSNKASQQDWGRKKSGTRVARSESSPQKQPSPDKKKGS